MKKALKYESFYLYNEKTLDIQRFFCIISSEMIYMILRPDYIKAVETK